MRQAPFISAFERIEDMQIEKGQLILPILPRMLDELEDVFLLTERPLFLVGNYRKHRTMHPHKLEFSNRGAGKVYNLSWIDAG